MMGTIYGVCLLVGGVLVLTSIFLGGHGDMDADMDASADLALEADFDADLDADFDIDADGDIHFDADHDIHSVDKADFDAGVWLPFLSLRFWIFGSAFFGLTGTVLQLLQGPLGVSSLLIHVASALMGVSVGTGTAYLFRALQRQEVNSMITPRQMVGQVAKVSIPIDNKNKGKIKLLINGERIDMIAHTEEEDDFKQGDEAFVIAIRDGEARVVSMDTIKQKKKALSAKS